MPRQEEPCACPICRQIRRDYPTTVMSSFTVDELEPVRRRAVSSQSCDCAEMLERTQRRPRHIDTNDEFCDGTQHFDITGLESAWSRDSGVSRGESWVCSHGQSVAWVCHHTRWGQSRTCDDCRRNRVLCTQCGDSMCSACGDLVSPDVRCPLCGTLRCADCGSCEQNNANGVRDCRVEQAHWRPTEFVHKATPDETIGKGTILMGMELEVGGLAKDIADAVWTIDRNREHLYMVYDYSIQRGVEIITHPMTLAWARQFPFADLLDRLRDAGCGVDDNFGVSGTRYGLHVHVTREAFMSDLHRMMWLMLMYRNSDMMIRLARRNSDRWASFREPEPGELKRKAETVEPLHDRHDRYYAVNCTNPATFELRFFKATLDVVELFAALEFVDASVTYTRRLKVHQIVNEEALSWRRFTMWVAKQDYPHLAAVIERRGHSNAPIPDAEPPAPQPLLSRLLGGNTYTFSLPRESDWLRIPVGPSVNSAAEDDDDVWESI